jgi:hypothetical protein
LSLEIKNQGEEDEEERHEEDKRKVMQRKEEKEMEKGERECYVYHTLARYPSLLFGLFLSSSLYLFFVSPSHPCSLAPALSLSLPFTLALSISIPFAIEEGEGRAN